MDEIKKKKKLIFLLVLQEKLSLKSGILVERISGECVNIYVGIVKG